jgi:putative transposase
MEINEIRNQVRIREWMELVRERTSSGMTINAWCEMKGISKYQYYYWLRKVRQEAYNEIENHKDSLPVAQEDSLPEFAHINVVKDESVAESSGISIRMNNADIHIGNDVHPEQLITVMQVIVHAK